MAQNNIKYGPTVNNFSTTLNGAVSDTATTVNLNSVTGLQNKAGILVVDRVDTSGNLTPTKQEWLYFTGVSGLAVTLPNTSDGRGVAGSTAQSHADGAIVEAVMDVSAWGGLITSYVSQHADAGTHTAITSNTLGLSSNASIAGNVFSNTLNTASTASISGKLNVYQTAISNQLVIPVGVSGASLSGQLAVDSVQKNFLVGDGTNGNIFGFGAWRDWTPTFANFTKGSATIVAKYIQIGKTVHYRLEVTLSSSTMGTAPTFSLPVTSVTYNVYSVIGNGQILDAVTATYNLYAQWATTTTATLQYFTTQGAGISAAVPMTWANGDAILLQGFYEAA